MKKIICLLGASLLILGSASGEPGDLTIQRKGMILRYQLEGQERYVVGGDVTIRFVLKNYSDAPLWVLTWYTPLEGLKGKIFRVTRYGVEVPYEGRLVKRGTPGKERYVRLGPGESVSARVDLSRTYNLSIPGEYHVQFTGRIFDVARVQESLPRKEGECVGLDIPGTDITFRIVQP